jgi:hypothetical protein
VSNDQKCCILAFFVVRMYCYIMFKFVAVCFADNIGFVFVLQKVLLILTVTYLLNSIRHFSLICHLKSVGCDLLIVHIEDFEKGHLMCG